jgi:ribose 5-phosphate isomerase B
MKLALASDHAGFPLKQHLVEYLRGLGHEVLDLGVETDTVRSDYTDAARKVGTALQHGDAERGILICGSGVGAAIAANKMKGIYASIAHDTYSAAQGVMHDNMNVLCLGSRIIGQTTGEEVTRSFLNAHFDSDTERYYRRFQQMQAMENGE